MNDVVLAVHGGAGPGRPLADAEATAARACLLVALRAGHAVLAAGGSALDAVEAAVLALEDGGVFNAGRGAVTAADGSCQLDAAVMDGATQNGGAVCATTAIANPVRAARLVLERSPHVLLAGAGADVFAARHGIEAPRPGHFLRRADPAAPADTVGAVARDAAGRLASATSTGGIGGKLPGRVGDAPLIGAGTWADRACAVSATGQGEFFIRAGFAHRVAMEIALAGRSPADAAERALAEVARLGGHGGAIVVGAAGDPALPFLPGVMFRGWIDAAGRARIGIGPEIADAGP